MASPGVTSLPQPRPEPVPAARSLHRRATILGRLAVSLRVWFIVCAAWAAVMAWVGRAEMNPDGLSYLDIGSEFLARGPGQLINSYWSPAYPALIGAALAVFRPSPEMEVPVVHLLNFVVFMGALCAFTFMLRRFLRRSATDARRYMIPLAYSIFLVVTMRHLGVALVTPDLMVVAIVFLIAGIVQILTDSPAPHWRIYLVLGAVLALGYYTKTAMFVIGSLLLMILFIRRPSPRVKYSGLLLSTLVFLALSAPWTAAVSRRAGRITIGEAGRLTYMWYTNYRHLTEEVGWTGKFAGVHASLAHPPRVLADKPVTLEFAEPLAGSYPLWYEPSYWWAGAEVGFSPVQQWQALMQNARIYAEGFAPISALAAGILGLCLVPIRPRPPSLLNRRHFWKFAWPAAAFAVFLPVHVEYRYIAGFVVLIGFAAYQLLLPLALPRASKAVIAIVTVALLIPLLLGGMVDSGGALRASLRGQKPDYQIVAEFLRGAGFAEGDRVAIVGYAFRAFYTRVARVRLAAQIQDEDAFWRLDAAGLDDLKRKLASVKVKGIVARNRPAGGASESAWLDVQVSERERYSVLLISE